jgi:hypothetical protein
MNWDKENQLLYWHPSSDQTLNQLIVGKERNIDGTIFPEKCKSLLEKTTFMKTFS